MQALVQGSDAVIVLGVVAHERGDLTPGADRFGVEHDTGESDQRSAGIDEKAVHGWRCSGRVGKIGRKRCHGASSETDRWPTKTVRSPILIAGAANSDVCSCCPRLSRRAS